MDAMVLLARAIHQDRYHRSINRETFGGEIASPRGDEVTGIIQVARAC
jgi:hypothetical protein